MAIQEPSITPGVSYAAEAKEAFASFVDTIAHLRAPDGCPWDREQTHASIAKNMIEEAFEAVDAIEADDVAHMREELGDVLLQVVLQAQIAADAGEFTVADVCRDVDAKMIRRHPHIFGDAAAQDSSEVLDLWDSVKLAERAAAHDGSSRPEGLLESVPVSFPALMQAQKVSKKAAAVGFEWDGVDGVWEKVFEEIGELKAAFAAAPKNAKGTVDAASPYASQVELEFGDVLFSVVNVGRLMGLDAESALRATTRKFRDRWAFMEGAAWARGERIEDLSLDALQELWNQAKAVEVHR